jgi:Domain of unknown function (DUF4365)
MAHTKRRVFQHIMEDESHVVVRVILPEQWVVRRYSPDYGIDCQVEIFEYIDAEKKKADTLGEMFFVQLKSIDATEIATITVEERLNVEKPAAFDEGGAKERRQIEVLKLTLDTDELMTVESMGAALPVLLFVVALDTERVFYVCLNDYIDKILLPENPDYKSLGSKAIYIPIQNEITDEKASFLPLRHYAIRAKLYAAFSKFAYQEHELRLHLDSCGEAEELDQLDERQKLLNDQGLALIQHYVASAKRLMIWKSVPAWYPLTAVRKRLDALEGKVAVATMLSDELINDAMDVWRLLTLLGRLYEEICREWSLPTFTALMLS